MSTELNSIMFSELSIFITLVELHFDIEKKIMLH